MSFFKKAKHFIATGNKFTSVGRDQINVGHVDQLNYNATNHFHQHISTARAGSAGAVGFDALAQVPDTQLKINHKPNPSTLFQGRQAELDRLKEIFKLRTADEPMSRRSVLLNGMGGIGKTQICLKFAEEIANEYDHIFWIDASSADTVAAGLKALTVNTSAVQLASSDDSLESLLKLVALLPRAWLLILDNANDQVHKFIPSGNSGDILITSRDRSVRRHTTIDIEIDEMSEEDAVSLLMMASHCKDPSSNMLATARAIVQELYCLPLAVDQAGAFIDSGRSTMADYLNILSKYKHQLLDDHVFKHATPYEQTVYGTWEISYQEIKAGSCQGNGPEAHACRTAISILETIAFFHHDYIDEDIFKRASDGPGNIYDGNITSRQQKKLNPNPISLINHPLLLKDNDGLWNEMQFRNGVQKLLAFSLLKQHSSGAVYSMHPLVHSWSRDRMTQSTYQHNLHLTETILLYSVPTGEMDIWDYLFLQRLMPHISANSNYGHFPKASNDSTCWKFAMALGETGQYHKAEILYLNITQARAKILGKKHPSTLSAMNNLARSYSDQGKWDEAEKLEMQVLNSSKRLRGEEHPSTLLSMGNLASTYSDQGKWDEAEKLQVQVLSSRKRLLGEEHPSTLLSMGNLAKTYSDQGKWDEAEKLEVQVLNSTKRLLGEEHPDTLLSMGNLASTYSQQGKWDEAEKLKVQVLNSSKRLQGEEHPYTLLSMGNLASTYSDQGKWDEAEKLEVQVLNSRKRLLGEEHPSTLLSMGNLARTYSDQGKWDEAEKLEVQVLNSRKRLLGEEHPDTLLSMGNLAMTYSDQGKWDEAEKLEVQVLSSRKRLLGEEHPSTLLSMGNLASTYSDQGKWDEAEKLQVQVFNSTKRLMGEEHPDTLSSMGNLASTYSHQRRWDEAEKLEVQVLDSRKRLLGEEHPGTLLGMSNLAVTYCALERWQEAENLARRCLSLQVKVLGKEHPKTLLTLNGLIMIYEHNGKPDAAEALKEGETLMDVDMV